MLHTDHPHSSTPRIQFKQSREAHLKCFKLPCPYCGIRDEPEFTFGGPSHIVRPDLHVTDEQWADYLYNKENPKGIHYERWCHSHSYGCARWFNIARHTVTHEILTVYQMGEPKPVDGLSCHPGEGKTQGPAVTQ